MLKIKEEQMATRDAYGKTLVELGEKNPNIVVLDADLSKSTKTRDFLKKFPERFFNMGIAEQGMIDTAVGLATSGKIPFASSFAMFATGRAWEQVRNSVGYPNSNVKIVATHSGISVGEDGVSHQACEDIAIMRCIPNMRIFCPADGVETKSVIKTVAEDGLPVYVRLGRAKFPVVFDEGYKFVPGKANLIADGKDVTIITTGTMISFAMKAVNTLEQEGISARLINMCSIKPIDKEIIVKASEETKGIVTVEEHNIIGGLGSAVAEVVAQYGKPCKMKFIGTQDIYAESGGIAELFKKYGLSEENICNCAKTLLGK